LTVPTKERIEETIDLGYNRDIEEKYEWGKELGKGGNGVVRVVVDRLTGEEYACKAIRKLPPQDCSDKKKTGHIDSIKREVEVLRRLAGSLNITKIQDVFEDHENVFIIQEYCKGGELHSRIGKRHYSERTVSSLVEELQRGPWTSCVQAIGARSQAIQKEP
jgi:calcium-dependent protein kinase